MSLQTRLAALIAAIGTDIKALKNASAARARVYRTVAKNHTDHGNWQKIPMDTIGIDPTGMFSAVNGSLICTVAGPFNLNAQLIFTPSAGGNNRVATIRVNGSPKGESNGIISAVQWCRISIDTGIIELNVGDAIELWAYQDTVGDLAYILTDGAGSNECWLSAVRVGAGPQGVQGVKGDPGAPNALPATVSPTAPVDAERQKWTRQADGALVAEVDAITTAGANQRGHYQAHARAAGVEKAQIDLDAAHSDGSSAAIWIQNAPYNATAKRRASAQVTKDDLSGIINKDIIRSDGTSDLIFADGREVGERGTQPSWNYGTDGYHPLPSTRNRYLTESDRKVLFWDMPNAAGGTVDMWPGGDGFWIVKGFYGFHYDSNLTLCALVGCSRYTSDGLTRNISILQQWTPATNVSAVLSVVSNNSTIAAVRGTSSHGNLRYIWQDMRGQGIT